MKCPEPWPGCRKGENETSSLREVVSSEADPVSGSVAGELKRGSVMGGGDGRQIIDGIGRSLDPEPPPRVACTLRSRRLSTWISS
jgi:hypothetical protein